MRISDWSSDVCSSDLRDCPTPVREHPWRRYAMAASVALAAFAGTVAYDHLVGRVSTERGEVRRIALEDGSILTLNGDSEVQEIGRASCRERGCQYVLISVDAVSLKKKNTHMTSNHKPIIYEQYRYHSNLHLTHN